MKSQRTCISLLKWPNQSTVERVSRMPGLTLHETPNGRRAILGRVRCCEDETSSQRPESTRRHLFGSLSATTARTTDGVHTCTRISTRPSSLRLQKAAVRAAAGRRTAGAPWRRPPRRLPCLPREAAAHRRRPSRPPAAPPAPDDEPDLAWHPLYGIVDVDYQYDTHAAPFNNYWFAGASEIVQKNSSNAVSGPGLERLEPIAHRTAGHRASRFHGLVGRLQARDVFNPTRAASISDALKSVAGDIQWPCAQALNTNIDSSVAGQPPFQQSYVGKSSKTWGTFTFGRQNTTLADLIAKYDPQQNSYAFSLLGLSGTPAGGGDTEDRRLDASIKYDGHFFDIGHLAAIYKTQGSSAASFATAGSGEAFSAFEVAAGAAYAGASVDVFYTKVKDAIPFGTCTGTAQLAASNGNEHSWQSLGGGHGSRTTHPTASWHRTISPRYCR